MAEIAPIRVEICVQGIASALAAGEGGADRIELCEDLRVGGVTPSAGAIAVACRRLSIPVHVLIRPRGGDFVPTDAEFKVMRHDIETAKALGAAGVALGVLTARGAVDRERTARLVETARPMSVTFHKAFDAVSAPMAALDDLIALGIDRVLTSGAAASARDGLDCLGSLTRQAAGRIVIMPGGAIGEPEIPLLIRQGLREIHIGSTATSGGTTDPEKVRRVVVRAHAVAF